MIEDDDDYQLVKDQGLGEAVPVTILKMYQNQFFSETPTSFEGGEDNDGLIENLKDETKHVEPWDSI